MTAEQAARERLVVGLRRRDGVDRAAFHAVSGYEIDALVGDALARWIAAGMATDDGAGIQLTRTGLLVSDSLWADVLEEPTG